MPSDTGGLKPALIIYCSDVMLCLEHEHTFYQTGLSSPPFCWFRCWSWRWTWEDTDKHIRVNLTNSPALFKSNSYSCKLLTLFPLQVHIITYGYQIDLINSNSSMDRLQNGSTGHRPRSPRALGVLDYFAFHIHWLWPFVVENSKYTDT